MATYGSRSQKQLRRGKAIAELLGLKQDEHGYYPTERGPKTLCGLFFAVQDVLKNTK